MSNRVLLFLGCSSATAQRIDAFPRLLNTLVFNFGTVNSRIERPRQIAGHQTGHPSSNVGSHRTTNWNGTTVDCAVNGGSTCASRPEHSSDDKGRSRGAGLGGGSRTTRTSRRHGPENCGHGKSQSRSIDDAGFETGQRAGHQADAVRFNGKADIHGKVRHRKRRKRKHLIVNRSIDGRRNRADTSAKLIGRQSRMADTIQRRESSGITAPYGSRRTGMGNSSDGTSFLIPILASVALTSPTTPLCRYMGRARRRPRDTVRKTLHGHVYRAEVAVTDATRRSWQRGEAVRTESDPKSSRRGKGRSTRS